MLPVHTVKGSKKSLCAHPSQVWVTWGSQMMAISMCYTCSVGFSASKNNVVTESIVAREPDVESEGWDA